MSETQTAPFRIAPWLFAIADFDVLPSVKSAALSELRYGIERGQTPTRVAPTAEGGVNVYFSHGWPAWVRCTEDGDRRWMSCGCDAHENLLICAKAN